MRGSDFQSRDVPASPCLRRGYSLVEMLVVISVMSIIASCMAVALHGMYRADKAARRELEANASLARLANRLRTDVHAATSAELDQDTLTLKSSYMQSIKYECTAGRIERLVFQGDKLAHRDGFRLAGHATPRWESKDDFVSLSVDRDDGKPARLEAHLGMARRFEKR